MPGAAGTVAFARRVRVPRPVLREQAVRRVVDYFDAGVTSHPPDLKRATIEIDGLTLSLYRVWFYGLYGANQDKVDILKHQLQKLNEQIA